MAKLYACDTYLWSLPKALKHHFFKSIFSFVTLWCLKGLKYHSVLNKVLWYSCFDIKAVKTNDKSPGFHFVVENALIQ